MIVVSAWRADASPGDLDATYVPIAGCRVTDTRVATNVGPRAEPLGPNEVMTVAIHGPNGECTGALAVPDDAVGVALNVTAVGATATSNIRVYTADLQSPPNLSNLNVYPGAPPTPNKVDVQLSSSGAIKVYNFKGTVDVLIDVVGYYSSATLLDLANRSGAAGPQGPVGPRGPAGADGSDGSDGSRGFSAWDVIPSGVTVTGNFVFDQPVTVANNGDSYSSAVTLPGIASDVLGTTDVNFAPTGNALVWDGDDDCTGSANIPTAPAGKVCLYLVQTSNVNNIAGYGARLGDRGFRVGWSDDGSGAAGQSYRVYATWAYTAP